MNLEKKDNFLSIFVLFFAALAEWCHLLFKGTIHSYYLRNGINTPIYLDDMVYYFNNEMFTLLLVVIVFSKMKTIAGKTIMVSIVIWFLIEFIEIVLQILKISDSRLFINDGSWLQIFTCTFTGLLTFFGSKK